MDKPQEQKVSQIRTDIKIEPVKKEKESGHARLITFLLVISVLLLGYGGVVSFKYFELLKEKGNVDFKLNSTINDKLIVEDNLKQMISQYDSIQVDNTDLQRQKEEEKQRVITLLEELKKEKSNSAYKISRYKKELGTLRDIMKSYIFQVDSLNTLNIALTAENLKVRKDYDKVSSDMTALETKTGELEDQVEMASVMKATNILPVAINEKSKETIKRKKVNKIRVCLTLRENVIARDGALFVYVRITDPNESLLRSVSNELFVFGEEKIEYSAKREVNYQNKDIDMCIYWTKDRDLLPGKYKVEIFMTGELIGLNTFILK